MPASNLLTRSQTLGVPRSAPRPVTTPLTRRIALMAATGLVLTACSAGPGSTTDEPTASTSPSPTSTVSVPPAVTLTEPGTDLSFGDPASVIFEPNQTRGSVLELTVTGVTKGSIEDFSAFILDDYTKAATPYYAEVTVSNVGEGEVGEAPVPLWGVDGENTLLPAASFTTSFPRCTSEPLPKRFAAGDSVETCLVYLAPEGGTLEAVSFRPDQEFDPIQWAGDIVTPKPKPEKGKKATKR